MSAYSVLRINGDESSPFKDFSFVKDLNLKALFDFRRGSKFGEAEVRLENYFTTDVNTIRLRQEMYSELIGNTALYERLKNSFSALYELFELQKVKSEAISTEVLLFGTLELENYVEYLEDLHDIFTKFDVKSELLRGLWETVKPLCTGEEYGELKKKISEHAYSVRSIRSVTIGVNLDPQLRPLEAGVVSVNDRSFVSGNLIDRILRLDLKKDGYTCISPFYPMNRKLSDEEFNLMKVSMSSAINKVFASAVGSWAGTVKNFVVSSLRELAPAVSEWRVVFACTDALIRLKQNGYPLCRAEFGEEDKITGMYHPILALLHADGEKRVVKNDLDFDDEAGIYILTGPNQGGKSIFTQAAGILYAMLHLGLLLPAKSAAVRPVDNILTHFIDDGHISYDHGRLSAECDKIYKINRIISENSLFLFDEALSSTNPTEAVAISTEIIKAYAEIGARGIWTTHFYELHGLTKEDQGNKSKIRSLGAVIDKRSHERQFRIVKGESPENSYAKDLAEKYKLSKDEIIKSASKLKS